MFRLVMFGVVLVAASNAHGQRYLQSYGTNGPQTQTFYIGTSSLGNPIVTTVLAGSLAANEPGHQLRNRMIPPEGIPGFGKRLGPDGQMRVYHGDQVQFWVSTDQLSWTWIPPGAGVNVPGTIVGFSDNGYNPPLLAGNAPAVGTVALFMLGVATLAAGAFIMRRRVAPPVAVPMLAILLAGSSNASAQISSAHSHYMPSLVSQPTEINGSVGVYNDIPGTVKTVTVPTGTAVITWTFNWAPSDNYLLRPRIGTSVPNIGLPTDWPGTTFRPHTGTWSTPVKAGEITVGLQFGLLTGNTLMLDSTSFVTWSLVVVPDSVGVPAVGGLGLAIVAAGLLFGGGYVMNHRRLSLARTAGNRNVMIFAAMLMFPSVTSAQVLHNRLATVAEHTVTGPVDYTDIVGTSETVVLPKGRAVITWSVFCGAHSPAPDAYQVRPSIGSIAPPEGPTCNGSNSVGSWVTDIPAAGPHDIRLQLRVPGNTPATYPPGVYFTWSIAVFPNAASGSVPAVGNVALLLLAASMLAAGMVVMRRRAAP